MPGVYYRFPIYKSTIDSTAPSFYKKETGKASIPYDESVEEALCFGWIDSIIRKMDEQRFARRFTPRDSSSRWSKLNMERAEKMMKEGKMEELGMSKIMDAKKTGEWCSSASPPGKLETPLFMKEALAENEKASRNFDNLAESYKRQYIAWVANARRNETRRRRLAEAIEHLGKGEKLGMK
ncbi:MAG: YdeI/OmpD-associated family protein [Promethearchaeati archaeon SRVP18_Atabeyarchaeia-1]